MKKNKADLVKKTKKLNKKFKFIWCKIPIAAVLVLLIGVTGVYIYVDSHIYHKENFADDWNDLAKKMNTTYNNSSATSSSEEDGLVALDADNLSAVEQKDYPIITIKQKDPNIENILILGIDGGDGGYGEGHRADSIIVTSFNKKDNTLKLTSLMRDIKTYFPNTENSTL